MQKKWVKANPAICNFKENDQRKGILIDIVQPQKLQCYNIFLKVSRRYVLLSSTY